MTMENLLTPVILTIGFILAGTHTTNAQCEFNHNNYTLHVSQKQSERPISKDVDKTLYIVLIVQ